MKTKTVTISFENSNINMEIFDYEYYKNLYTDQRFDDESVGLDIISYCLETDKCWEPFQTEITTEILKNRPKGVFMDIGCQLGYYSILSSIIGVKTISIDSCGYFLDILKQTIKINNLQNINVIDKNVDSTFDMNDYVSSDDFISLMKIDIEGSEHYIIDSLDILFEREKIQNLIIEISPKLNNTYENICRKLNSYGFNIYDIGLSPQRKLNYNTQHLKDIHKLKIDIDKIDEYLQTLSCGQSNFLFSLNF